MTIFFAGGEETRGRNSRDQRRWNKSQNPHPENRRVRHPKILARLGLCSTRLRDLIGSGELVDRLPVGMHEAIERQPLAANCVGERTLMELHVCVVKEQDVHELVLGALELLPREDWAVLRHERRKALALAHHEAAMLEAHPVDTLVEGRNQLDQIQGPSTDGDRLGENDLRDRAAVPDVFAVGNGQLLEPFSKGQVLPPGSCAERNMTDRQPGYLDAEPSTSRSLLFVERGDTPENVLQLHPLIVFPNAPYRHPIFALLRQTLLGSPETRRG